VLLADPDADLKEIFLDTVYVTTAPAGDAQGLQPEGDIDAIRKYDIVFGIGPAGTGKTYLAMAIGGGGAWSSAR